MSVSVNIGAPSAPAASASQQRPCRSVVGTATMTCRPISARLDLYPTRKVGSRGLGITVAMCGGSGRDVGTGGPSSFGTSSRHVHRSPLSGTASRSPIPTGGASSQVGTASSMTVTLEVATLPQLRPVDARAACWYQRALELARQQQFEHARRVFQATVTTYPNLCRAWVSWAQVCSFPDLIAVV